MALSIMNLTVDWRKSQNEKLHDLYSYFNSIMVNCTINSFIFTLELMIFAI